VGGKGMVNAVYATPGKGLIIYSSIVYCPDLLGVFVKRYSNGIPNRDP
jgi:hypothetical protein